MVKAVLWPPECTTCDSSHKSLPTNSRRRVEAWNFTPQTRVVSARLPAVVEAEMGFPLRVAMLLLLSCLPLEAQDHVGLNTDPAALQPDGQAQADVGGGVICDTRAQVERFATLRGEGKEPADALQTVNQESRDADACNVTFVMFTTSKPIAGMTISGRPASILEITVKAFGNGRTWKQVAPIVQYTVAMEKGRVS
jgi:hypothetical protein